MDVAFGVGFFEQFVEAEALDLFHHEERAACLVAAEIVGGEDVGVFEHAAEARLVFEEAFAIACVGGLDDLDGDVAVEDGVAEAEDLALSSLAQGIDVLIAFAVIAARGIVGRSGVEEAGEEEAVGISENLVDGRGEGFGHVVGCGGGEGGAAFRRAFPVCGSCRPRGEGGRAGCGADVPVHFLKAAGKGGGDVFGEMRLHVVIGSHVVHPVAGSGSHIV